MFIFSNLATSLDGKIATRERAFTPLGTQKDLNHMKELRQLCDALLIGAGTFRVYKKASTASSDSTQQPINLLLSSSLEGISPQWKFFQKPDLKRILFVLQSLSVNRLKAFSKTSEVVCLEKPTPRKPIAIQIVRFLEERGIQRLLLEGGGSLMWDFARLNLIDEYHVTLTPKIVGGSDSPTLVDGLGFSAKNILNLKLRQCRTVGDEIFLTYAKK
jgi:riboflavin-specific deaminase-like protein